MEKTSIEDLKTEYYYIQRTLNTHMSHCNKDLPQTDYSKNLNRMLRKIRTEVENRESKKSFSNWRRRKRSICI